MGIASLNEVSFSRSIAVYFDSITEKLDRILLRETLHFILRQKSAWIVDLNKGKKTRHMKYLDIVRSSKIFDMFWCGFNVVNEVFTCLLCSRDNDFELLRSLFLVSAKCFLFTITIH